MAETKNALLAKNIADHPLVKKIVESKVNLQNCAPIAEMAQKAIDLVSECQQHLSLKADDHNDSTAIELAKKTRSQIKKDRVATEKYLDAKREDVQTEMAVYKDQDTALLKIKQYVVDGLKTVESHLEDQEKIRERHEEQERKKRVEERNAILSEVCEDPSIYNVGDMTQSAFDALVFGIKAQKEAAEKAQKEEEERIEREKQLDATFQERRFQLQKYSVLPNSQDKILSLTRETSQEEFTDLITELDILLTDFNNAAEIARQEAAQKEKTLRERNEKLRPYIVFIRDYDKVLDMSDEDFEKELKSLNQQAIEQANFEAQEREKVRKEQEAQAEKLRLEQKKLQKEREELARIEQEKLAKASGTISEWVDQFMVPSYIETENSEIESIRKEIISKFDGFKKWAKSLTK